jgi:autotransporter-associated beta strand protein
VLNVSGGVLDLGGTSQTTSALTLTGGTIQDGTLTSTAFNTQSGTISAILAGAGQLTQSGDGTTILSGANTYTGGTQLDSGTLQVGGNSALGSGAVTFNGGVLQAGPGASSLGNGFVVDTSTATIDTQANTLTLSGSISDGPASSGGLTKIGSGTLVLSGASSYAGATNVNAGTLQAGAANAFAPASAFTVAAGAVLNLNNFNQTVGSLAGPGNVTLGSGTLTLSNASGTFSGVISGGGALAQSAGIETLSGANTYSGGTLLNGGVLAVGNNSALGTGTLSMAAGTTLAFLSTGNFTIGNKITITGDPNFAPFTGTTDTISGVIAGNGTLNLLGFGTLDLAASNTYTGPTNVVVGTLDVTGSIASSSLTTVSSTATLTGTGTIGNLQIAGTFAPGSGTAGTSTAIAGNLAFQSGAVYLVQVNPSAASSATVAGTASLAGAADAVFAPGSYLTKQYVILQSGGVSGTFSALTTTNLPAGFTASLAYTPGDVLLDLTSAVPTSGLNLNQTSVATALNNFFNSGGTLPPTFLNIFGLTGGNLANALTQLDGEDATGAEHGAIALTNEFLGLMLDPFVYGRGGAASGSGALGFAPDQETSLPPDVALAYAGLLKAPPKPQTFDQLWTVWGAGYGGSATFDGNATVGSTDITASTYGFAAGADYHAAPDMVLGFALAGAGTDWGLANSLGSGRSDAFQGGVYGTKYLGPAYLGAALAFTNNWFTTNRIALGDQLTATFQGQSFGARVEGGYRYALQPAMGVTPYAAIQAQSFHTPSYSETDLTSGGFGLTYNVMNATDTRSELGARFDELTTWGAMPVQLRARLAWAHDWVSDPALSAVFEALPGSSFVVNGAPVPHDSALTSLGAELHLTPQWTLIGKFDGEFASSAQTYAGSGTLRYQW